MSSENLNGADNQQERLDCSTWLEKIPQDLGHYIAGFVDGEGSFNVPIRQERDRKLPWRVGLRFNVSQVGPESAQLLFKTFGVGTIWARRDGVYYFEVTKPSDLEGKIFPFFDRFPLRGAKAADLMIFRQICQLVQSGRHLLPEGIEEIVKLRSPMNRGGKRRRTDEVIIQTLRSWESSETIRKALPLKLEDEDMVHAP